MSFTTFWCGRCNRNKQKDQLARRKGGSAICQNCEKTRLEAMTKVRKWRKEIRNREQA